MKDIVGLSASRITSRIGTQWLRGSERYSGEESSLAIVNSADSVRMRLSSTSLLSAILVASMRLDCNIYGILRARNNH